jgi:hypothetical protein
LIQVRGRSAAGSAQPRITASKAVSQRMSNTPWRTVRAAAAGRGSRERQMPRHSGSTQKISGSSAESAIGKIPAA